MSLLQQCQQEKLTLIALFAIVREGARALGLSLEGTLSEICRQAEVNRSQVYEKQQPLMNALEKIEWAGRGRPSDGTDGSLAVQERQARAVVEQVLRYRLGHPGAMVEHASAQVGYSDGFKRFILDVADTWSGSVERFCELIEVPYPTFRTWQQRDRQQSFEAQAPSSPPALSDEISEVARAIVEDYARWEGSYRDFLRYAVPRHGVPATPIRRVLVITGLIPATPKPTPRYRGSTQPVQPGTILVTDGKSVKTVSTVTGDVASYNWQGIVDQATACHTAVVVTDTEGARGVQAAFEASCEYLGQPPQVLLHDNKPLYEEATLKTAVEATTEMIPATAARPQNKAVLEGEFGKFEQTVGPIHLDDSSPEDLKRSAVSEIVRAYVAGVNHAQRAELNGHSRCHVLRAACPNPDQDRAFIERLRATHSRPRPTEVLPTQPVSRALLDAAFAHFGLEKLDPEGQLRGWLSGRYTPPAIRQALALFGAERAKGRLQSDTAHRYLVKLIQSQQEELDLRHQEVELRRFAEIERQAWLIPLEQEFELLQAQCDDSTLEKDLAFQLSERAVFGSLLLQRAFWEAKLHTVLHTQRERVQAVCRHVRRLFEAPWNDRFQLMSHLVSWEFELASCDSV